MHHCGTHLYLYSQPKLPRSKLPQFVGLAVCPAQRAVFSCIPDKMFGMMDLQGCEVIFQGVPNHDAILKQSLHLSLDLQAVWTALARQRYQGNRYGSACGVCSITSGQLMSLSACISLSPDARGLISLSPDA